MPSMKTALLAGLVAVASAYPTPSGRHMEIFRKAKRATAAEAALGIEDVDVLQFALTAEHLESEFYRQGFAKFPASDFQALGLTQQQIDDLITIGQTEQSHVTLLQSAIAQAGIQPVQPCTYNFGFTDAAGMVATAAVLENIGVSAYLGAAPIIEDSSILATAGSILTIEARHQTLIRTASQKIAIPQPLDTPLGVRAVFSLAAPFIESCPDGSNLILEPFPTLELADPADVSAVAVGTNLVFSSEAATQATHCAFTSSDVAGGTAFVPHTAETGCEVPQNINGVVYVSLASQDPGDNVLTDEITVAGPTVVTLT